MQHVEEYEGGVYTSTPIPPDQSAIYVGGPTYGSAPPSAPSAPAYSQTAPSSHQPSLLKKPLVPAYNCHASSSFSHQPAVPSYPTSLFPQNPPSSLAEHSLASRSSYNSLYASSYSPVVPYHPAVGDSNDRSFKDGVTSTFQSTTSVDLTGPQQLSHYGNSWSVVQKQTSADYECYGQGKIGSCPEGEQGYRGSIYDPGYGLSELGHYRNGDRTDQIYDNGCFSGVYAYDGGSVEPFGSRGARTNSWAVDCTGNSGDHSSSRLPLGSKSKITRAKPQADGDAVSGGVQRFRVQMLPETSSTESIKDVVCQIGLDGVRMVDPSTSRILRIYPLDTITKWEVKEPSVFTFWAKSAVDVDQRIIQLKSSDFTTTAILDTLTAACVQLCEMVGKEGTSEGSNSTGGAGTALDGSAMKRSSVLDWVALRSRAASMEEKQHWVPDEAVTKCTSCRTEFGAFLRRHHCRNCGDIFCDKCTRGRITLNTDEDSAPVRVCDHCLAEVTHRLENMIKANSKVSAPQRTHEDLAKKLQEELERNHAGRKPGSTTSSSWDGDSQQTSVLNCIKCGSITLAVGDSGRCSNCGGDSGNLSSSTEKTTGALGSSASPNGPPNLWSNNSSACDGASPNTQEVACPTCTVHLQVQVPSFGTETVECGVCQHPFLVSA